MRAHRVSRLRLAVNCVSRKEYLGGAMTYDFLPGVAEITTSVDIWIQSPIWVSHCELVIEIP
jgi:hypothetical protein